VAAAPQAQAEAPCTATGPRTVAYRTVPGVAANLTSLDLYLPRGACRARRGGAPVVVWVHGGAYAVGDKAQQVADKVRHFTRRGWIFASVNYRLTRPGDPASARFPDHFDDVAAAVAWLRRHIARRGGDRSRIALLGHSAGADIVSNVAVNPRYLAAHRQRLRALRCAAPLDTAGFDKTRATDREQRQWRLALGNEPGYGAARRPRCSCARGSASRRRSRSSAARRTASRSSRASRPRCGRPAWRRRWWTPPR
jgi:hypothetical protein